MAQPRWNPRIRERGESKESFYCILVVLIWMYSSASSHGIEACSTAEYEALLQFKKGVDPYGYFVNWIEGSDCCRWTGVACSNETRSVISLSLSTGMLEFTVGDYISSFQDLQQLDLGENLLSGSILQHFCTLRRLQVLNLSYNRLNGSVPECMGNLTALRALRLSGNGFTGGLPSSMSQLSQLSILDVSFNSLDGRIEWFDSNSSSGNGSAMDKLEILDLRFNNFVGTIPPSFGIIHKKLTILNGKRNRFSGDISSSFGNLTALRYIDLSDNRFSGQVPAFENCLKLEKVKLGGNSFEGLIPSSFRSLQSLTTLSVRNNQLTSPMPSLRNCRNLTVLDVSSNLFNETVPLWLRDFGSSLRVIRLGSNRFEGDFPTWLASLENLEVLDLSNNKISGALPRSINRFQSYKNRIFLDLTISKGSRVRVWGESKLEDGYFQEDIFLSFRNGFDWNYNYALVCWSSIDVSRNDLQGFIPSELGDLNGLRFVNFSSNKILGPIPPSIQNMEFLQSLDLSCNNLTGPIPYKLTFNAYLFELNVSYNRLSGPIPQGYHFSTFSNLAYLGNSGLCGFPLDPCLPERKVLSPMVSRMDGFDDWLAITSLAIGFGIGFLGSWTFILLSGRARRFIFTQGAY